MVIALLLLTGCSTKGVYQDLQRNKHNQCVQLPVSEYQKCMQDMSKSYEEYQQQREQVLKSKAVDSKKQPQ